MNRGSGKIGNSLRAQSGPLGLLLVFALVIASTTLVVTLGAGAITDTQNQLDTQRTEKTMTQLDSQAALVALGQSEVQQIRLPDGSSNNYRVDSSAGWMNVSYTNATGVNKTIRNATMGALVAEGDRGQIAYQGGGVWRSDGNGNSVMISPPELHYRDKTLTLPLITIAGDGDITNRVVINNSSATQYYPDPNKNDFGNPVSGRQVTVTIKSEYYKAWGEYFVERTDGSVQYDDQNNIVRAELVSPFEGDIDEVVGTTQPNGLSVNGTGGPPTPNDEGIGFPSVDSKIESEIEDCQNIAGACDDSKPTLITSGGTYNYSDDPKNNDDIEVKNPDGNVTIVMEGAYTPDNFKITNMNEDPGEDYQVNVYVRDDFVADGEVNRNDGDADELKVLVHSDGEVDLNGNTFFVGLLAAPGSTCDENGKGDVRGGIICETVDVNGNPSNRFIYDEGVEDFGFDFVGPNDVVITYLHVSENEVRVSD